MRLWTLSASIVAVAAMSFVASANTPIRATHITNSAVVQGAGEALIAQEQQNRLEINEALAPVKTRSVLITYQTLHKKDSPLSALQPMNRQIFIDSLRFGSKGGVASFDYVDLKSLTPTQIYKILSLFGLQSFTPSVGSTNIKTKGDKLLMNSAAPLLQPPVKDMRCAGHHNCVRDDTSYCTQNC